jgi:hypothetical protein
MSQSERRLDMGFQLRWGWRVMFMPENYFTPQLEKLPWGKK